jgi:hypothetical protein
MKAFRTIHYFSLAAYLMVAVHGFFSGTDTPLAAVQLMYVSTFLVTVFLTVYWVLMVTVKKPANSRQPTADSLRSS